MYNYKNLFWVFLTLNALGCKKSNNSSKVAEIIKPNIIFLLTDDQRWDCLSFAGNKTLKTPSIDSLAANGIYFENAYVTTSICAVSRASILTGQYARRHQIWGFDKNLSSAQLDNTYPILLKKAGYSIGFIGKYGVGNQLPKEHFDYWKGFAGQGTYNQTDESGSAIHLTKKIGKQAIDFLESSKDSKKPFCLSISFKAPHVEGDPGYFNPDDTYRNLFQNDSIQVPETSKREYFDHFPENFTENNVARNRWKTRFATPHMQQESIRKYYQLIYGVDKQIGHILAKLRETGLDENTVIIFSSDNGFYLGEYGFAGKWYGSDPSIRVPLIIYDPRPNKYKAQMIKAKALNIDIAPTILALAGVQPNPGMQGKNLLETIDKPEASWRNAFFYEHLWQSSSAYYIPSTEGLVSGNMKYMRYFKNQDTTDLIFEELYDLKQDPFEKNNLIIKPGSFEVKAEMLKEFYRIKNTSK